MRDYELLYILPGDKSEDEATKVTDEVNAALLKSDGKVDDENFWGRRKLAYPVAKQDHGWYVVTRFAMKPDKLTDFDKALRLNQQVIRTLIINAADLPTAEESSKLSEVEEAAEKKLTAKPAARKAAKKTVATPETVRKAAPKKPAVAAKKTKPQAPKKETAAEKKQRQAKLDQKLSEILKD